MTDENRATIRKALKAFDDENFHNGNDCTLSSTALAILDAEPSPRAAEASGELYSGPIYTGNIVSDEANESIRKQAEVNDLADSCYEAARAMPRTEAVRFIAGLIASNIASNCDNKSRPAPTAEKGLRDKAEAEAKAQTERADAAYNHAEIFQKRLTAAQEGFIILDAKVELYRRLLKNIMDDLKVYDPAGHCTTAAARYEAQDALAPREDKP